MKKIKNLFVFSVLALVLMTTSSCKKACNPVTAAFDWHFTEIIILRTTDGGPSITFDNISENAQKYLWDFGDGATSTDENPTHVYSNYNSKTVKLTSSNGKSTATAVVKIQFPS
jgi:uncharacterized membrane protein